jgi:hypothetical protein
MMVISSLSIFLEKWLTKKRIAFLKHFSLALLLLVLIYIGMGFFRNMGDSTAKEWTSHDPNLFQAGDCARIQFEGLEFSRDIKQINTVEKDRLREQFVEIRNRAIIHLKVMLYYYTVYVMATSMATVLALAASIIFLFVSRSGWATANPYILTALIVTASTATFFGLAPNLYKQHENLEANKKLYVSYKALENRILSYVATGHDLSTDNKIKKIGAKTFIHRIDAQLEKLHQFPIEIDPTVIPEPSKVLQDIVPQ